MKCPVCGATDNVRCCEFGREPDYRVEFAPTMDERESREYIWEVLHTMYPTAIALEC